MRLLFLLAGIALPLVATPAHSPAGKAQADVPRAKGIVDMPQCNNPHLHPVDSGGKAEAKRLGELPPASMMLAVVRDVNGCHEPVIVRYGIGAGADRSGVPSSDRGLRGGH